MRRQLHIGYECFRTYVANLITDILLCMLGHDVFFLGFPTRIGLRAVIAFELEGSFVNHQNVLSENVLAEKLLST
jgi:hypothetical protein